MDISRNDLKKFSSLKRKKKRHEHDLFVVEGEKICSELHKSNLEIVITLATSELKSIYPEYTTSAVAAPLNISSRFTSTVSTLLFIVSFVSLIFVGFK